MKRKKQKKRREKEEDRKEREAEKRKRNKLPNGTNSKPAICTAATTIFKDANAGAATKTK